ncbi:hypothetical protein [Burkholderia sp. Bp9142]|nr:hypothetical protein [Burkholderia sp. Bp9142]
MDDRKINRLGLAVVALLAFVIVIAASKGDLTGTAASKLGHLHAQPR